MANQPKGVMPANRHKSGFRGPSPDVGKATQFKPGQSGNPSGRAKWKPISDAYRRELLKPAEGKKGLTNLDLLAARMVNKAVRSGDRAARELADRIEGRATLALDISGDMDITAGRSIEEMEFFVKHGHWPEQQSNE